MAYNEVSKKATMKYIKEKMQQFTIRFTKSDYDEQVYEARLPEIKQAIYEKIERDGLSIVEHPDNE